MIYFLLPKNYLFTYKSIDYTETEDIPTPIISNSLSHYLCDIKEKINEHDRDWDVYKKYTNPYEYIHSIIPNRKKSISKYKPLSRSYFKMIEIVNLFKLKEFVISPSYYVNMNDEMKSILKPKTSPIRTFHLAEGPGGFIEAMVELRQNPNDIYIGMTIQDDVNNDVPAWKKSQQFLRSNPNVIIENGPSGDGNILNIENLAYCKTTYGSSMDFITADGGFDFSFDFNHQENNIAKLLFAQIAFALTMQKKDGHFVIKIFDSFMPHSIDLLYILSSFYEKVYICKPQTSRFANSEKYIVCKKFVFTSNHDFYPYLYNAFSKMMQETNKYVHRFLSTPISNYFFTKIEEYNSIFGQQQIENIHNTITLIESKYKTEKIEQLIKTNIQKSTTWCIKNNIEYNVVVNSNANNNIFLSNNMML